MPNTVSLTIDDTPVTVPAGSTLLDAATAAGIQVPTICYHEACTANALCRQCVVEVAGQRLLQPSCVVKAVEGQQVQSRSPRVERARRTILEMLASTVDLSDAPPLQAQMADYHADPERFPDAERRDSAPIDDNVMFIRDYAKCILCWRCVQVCADDAQFTHAINFAGRGYETQIATFFDRPMPESSCVFCGQCVGVCPTGALKPRREWLLEQGKTPDEIMEMTRSSRRRAKRRKE